MGVLEKYFGIIFRENARIFSFYIQIFELVHYTGRTANGVFIHEILTCSTSGVLPKAPL